MSLVLLTGCDTCGFDCSDDDNNKPTFLTIGLSDSQPEDLKELVLQVDSIVLARNGVGEEDIEITTFTIPELDLVDAPSVPVSLLEYKGVRQLLVVEGLEIDADFYDAIILNVSTGSVSTSYVQEQDDDALKILNVNNAQLSFPGRRFSSGDAAITIEFELARALQYLSSNDTYLLGTEGTRVTDTALAGQITGEIDNDLFDTVSPCSAKDDPLVGNRLYLYQGQNLDEVSLGDVFPDGAAGSSGITAPYAVATIAFNELTAKWEYAFGYLPQDDYTLAFSCDTEEDDSADYDELTVPLPAGQVYEVSVAESEQVRCDIIDGTSC